MNRYLARAVAVDCLNVETIAITSSFQGRELELRNILSPAEILNRFTGVPGAGGEDHDARHRDNQRSPVHPFSLRLRRPGARGETLST